MLNFNSFVSVVICARSDGGLQRWSDLFGRLFENFTITEGVGGWVGPQVVETEGNRTITAWGAEWPTVKRVLRLARRLAQVEQQEAISIVWSTPKAGWQANVVFNTPEDWAEVEKEARCAFNAPRKLEVPVDDPIRKVFPEMKGKWFD